MPDERLMVAKSIINNCSAQRLSGGRVICKGSAALMSPYQSGSSTYICQVIAIERLHDLAKTFVGVILSGTSAP